MTIATYYYCCCKGKATYDTGNYCKSNKHFRLNTKKKKYIKDLSPYNFLFQSLFFIVMTSYCIIYYII